MAETDLIIADLRSEAGGGGSSGGGGAGASGSAKLGATGATLLPSKTSYARLRNAATGEQVSK